VGCFYAAGAFSFWSVLGLFLGNDNNGVVFSLGSVPRLYFFACFWGCYWKRNFKPAQQLRVSKFCESEMDTKDTHLVL
jgi:hypothetical protein